MNTLSYSIYGVANAKFIAFLLMEGSMYFAFTPLPGDWYEFTFKECDQVAFIKATNKLHALYNNGLLIRKTP